VLSKNLIIHRCIELGSIKFSVNKRLGLIKSEFTCCSNSFARALVIALVINKPQISNVETIADAILSCRKIYLVGIIIDLGKNLVRTSATGQHLGLT
jgi:hypothetical protein